MSDQPVGTDQFRLDGKVAIVTGASRGLGRGAARALASAGASVALIGRDRAALEESLALLPVGEHLVVECDVTRSNEMLEALATIASRVGVPDILINNAGIIRRSPAVDYRGQDWNEVIDTNLNAVFSWAQAVGKMMIERGSGKIINLASLLSFGGGLNVAAYAAAKGGVAQLTKALANEWAKYGVNVNAVAPGYFKTDATAALRSNSERSAQLLGRIPAGRWGEPDDLAGAFVFLASNASDYVNGHVLVVDGGYLGF